MEMSKNTAEGHHKQVQTIGTHCAGFRPRTIEQCLRCEFKTCDGCPRDKVEDTND